MSLILNYENAIYFNELNQYQEKAQEALNTVLKKNGLGNQYLGWVHYPKEYEREEIKRIVAASQKIRNESDVLVVVGIGGSYLGAKAAIEMLKDYFDRDFEILFVGNTLSSSYTAEVLKYLENKDFSINVISKSGTTTEPAIAFRLLKNLLEKKYHQDANNRIYVTTDPEEGILRQEAKTYGWESFNVPQDIGGRYSVLTAVGLLPIACSGIDIYQILEGAQEAVNAYTALDFHVNQAMQYASMRNILDKHGKKVEVFTFFEPKLRYLGEWLKQLFGESEGKDEKGLFPASLIYSTDLHSMGQFVQDGSKILFETIVNVEKPTYDLYIPEGNSNDGLDYLNGKSLNYINNQAMKATVLAHNQGNVPVINLTIPEINPYNFGYLVYFFMMSCAISGYILGVNPFNQEGVEAYKKNMFALLGKKGY
ncbi:MAG TPA: glucose-6-phosphate isomerase [Bacilli bacterium]